MKSVGLFLSLVLIIAVTGCQPEEVPETKPVSEKEDGEVTGITIALPEPRLDGEVSLEQSLLGRRSTRSYTGEPLTLEEVSQLLWAAQGITNTEGHRTAPSAGGLYPLELYVVAGDVTGLEPGIYHYLPEHHELALVARGDIRSDLSEAALSQAWVADGAISVVMTAVYERTTTKYGDRGIQYVHMEAGHAAQNLCLQATALGLGLVTVGAFYVEELVELLNLPDDEIPLYVIPAGRK
jgi:SagB-type dehydrogenase family enzyme